ncbi:MAG: putative enoyl-CoA hydratase EchA13 [Pseudonocardiales bacterium]|nr:putative enoyl-CoA hydratase EchA13 [Pseudonocardiales bacterium]
MSYEFVQVESLDEGRIARILLNRPDKRNAQNRQLLVELDDAMLKAEADDDIRVVILGGVGKMFSAGHDISPAAAVDLGDSPDRHPSTLEKGGTRLGAERRMLQEWHFFYQNTLRWRNLRKITIAQVHGPVFAAGLMLAWACDLIVAAEDTTFADVTGTRLGMCGVEYFAHPWEFGPRKTKELMLTGDSLSAKEAYELGMISRIFPNDTFREQTVEFARRVAGVPTMASVLIKEAVNQAQDNMGFYNSLQATFSLHQLNHSHWAELTNGESICATPEHGVPDWKTAPPPRAVARDVP